MFYVMKCPNELSVRRNQALRALLKIGIELFAVDVVSPLTNFKIFTMQRAIDNGQNANKPNAGRL